MTRVIARSVSDVAIPRRHGIASLMLAMTKGDNYGRHHKNENKIEIT